MNFIRFSSRLTPFIVITLIAALNIALWRTCNLQQYLTLAGINEHRTFFLQFINNNYWSSVLLYFGAYIVNVALFLPATALMIILGGFLFGVAPAVCYALIGATAGASVAFIIIRYGIGRSIQARYQAQLAPFNEQLNKHMIRYLLFVRIVPIFPFSLINLLAGLSLVPFATFLWTTAVGIIPNLIVYSAVGRELASLTKFSDLLQPTFIAALLFLTLLSIVPLFVQRRKS